MATALSSRGPRNSSNGQRRTTRHPPAATLWCSCASRRGRLDNQASFSVQHVGAHRLAGIPPNLDLAKRVDTAAGLFQISRWGSHARVPTARLICPLLGWVAGGQSRKVEWATWKFLALLCVVLLPETKYTLSGGLCCIAAWYYL